MTARWQKANGDRLTGDQRRVLARLDSNAPVELVLSNGPAGIRRRVAIAKLVALGKIRVVSETGDVVLLALA